MNKRSLQQKRNEMTSIWKSFEWLLKDKLIALDDNARTITTEMRTMGVPADMASRFGLLKINLKIYGSRL